MIIVFCFISPKIYQTSEHQAADEEDIVVQDAFAGTEKDVPELQFQTQIFLRFFLVGGTPFLFWEDVQFEVLFNWVETTSYFILDGCINFFHLQTLCWFFSRPEEADKEKKKGGGAATHGLVLSFRVSQIPK